jgi:hypothetical protein
LRFIADLTINQQVIYSAQIANHWQNMPTNALIVALTASTNQLVQNATFTATDRTGGKKSAQSCAILARACSFTTPSWPSSICSMVSAAHLKPDLLALNQISFNTGFLN